MLKGVNSRERFDLPFVSAAVNPLKMTTETAKNIMAKLKEELSDLTPEEIQHLKEKMGLKAFQRVFSNVEEKSENCRKGPKPRENKNRPTEISSKKRVNAFHPLPGVKKKFTRDPRFDDISGQFREDIFKRDYAFISDLKAQEKKKILKQLKKEKNEQKKEKLKYILNKMAQEEQTREKKKKKQELLQLWKEKEKERVKDGKTPYFLKKSDIRKLELAENFKALKEKGQVKKVIEKKRRRNASKLRKKMQFDFSD